MGKIRIFITLFLLLTLLLGGCRGVEPPPERFFLAFAQEGTSQIKVRYSSDGTTWEDGNFTGSAAGTSFRGITAAADDLGYLHIVMTDKANAINFVWGLGPAIWDNSAESEPSIPPNSAPSASFIGDSLWLVTYRRSDDTIAANVYDINQKRFIIEVAPQGPLNSEGCGTISNRPAVTNMKGKLLLVWCNGGQLVSAIGEVNNNNMPIFSQPRIIPLPADNEFRAGFTSSPSVTHDHNNFFVIMVREEPSSGQLHGWGVEVQQSLDGETWSLHSRPSFSVNNQTFISIGGMSNRTLMAASVKQNDGIVSVSKFSNGSWVSLNDAQVREMFDTLKIEGKPFALIGTGKP